MIDFIINVLEKISKMCDIFSNDLKRTDLSNRYYVYVPENNKPVKVHYGYKSAEKEADRLLTILENGERVQILKIVSEYDADGIPF